MAKTTQKKKPIAARKKDPKKTRQTKAKKVKVVHVKTQAQLQKMARKSGTVRVGSTNNPRSRASNYGSTGYRGIMYAAPTKNMMRSEDRLLKKPKRHNVHSQSNAQEDKAYIYAIKGQRRK